MIKLQDFARECGVTDRAVQKHLKTYAEELEGLFERRGPNGTWLTDEACEILRSKMKQQPIAVFEADPRIGQLEHELSEVKAAAKDMWEQAKQKDLTIASLVEQNRQLQLKADSVARLEADNELAKAKVTEAERTAQTAREGLMAAQNELAEAHKAFERDLRKKNAQLQAWERYAVDLAAYQNMKPVQRWISGAKKPIPPVFEEEE